MRRVAQIMGMPITLDIPICEDESTFNKVFEHFRQVDKRFSPYKKHSELSRFNRGDISRAGLSAEMKTVMKACQKAQDATNGYFDAWYSGEFDPSGYVKGWAIARAGKLLKGMNYKTFCISAGGDILAASDGKKIWNIGIQDPKDPKKLLDLNMLAPPKNLSGAVGNRIAEHQVFGPGLSITSGAVATSGNYERGEHIINPKTGKPARDFLSVTVTGPGIIKADILATAAFAMGKTAHGFVAKQRGYKFYPYPGK